MTSARSGVGWRGYPDPVSTPHGQSQYQVRFDWGLEGAADIAAEADVIVVVDVLSFATTVDLAVGLGAGVVPVDPEASVAAQASGATVAGRRGEAGVTLSPASITAETVAAGARIVLPSPNGSRVVAGLRDRGAQVVVASLRNRTAIAKWVLEQQGDKGDRFYVAIIAAGEQRADGTIRFAVEDLLGAGAVIDALADVGVDYCSPEAAAAAAAFTGLRNATGHLIGASASGREMAGEGYRGDIDLAIDVDASSTVPVLDPDGVLVAARPPDLAR
jgi:2-phosphosulfolactate phosphatase